MNMIEYYKERGLLNKMGKFLYIVYEWTDRTIKVVSCNRDKAYAKIGEDFLAGENIDDYHVIEVNLEDENLLQEMKEIMSMVVETKGFMESCSFEINKEYLRCKI